MCVEGSGLGVESENLAKLFIKINILIVPNANILCLLSQLQYVSNLYLS